MRGETEVVERGRRCEGGGGAKEEGVQRGPWKCISRSQLAVRDGRKPSMSHHELRMSQKSILSCSVETDLNRLGIRYHLGEGYGGYFYEGGPVVGLGRVDELCACEGGQEGLCFLMLLVTFRGGGAEGRNYCLGPGVCTKK